MKIYRHIRLIYIASGIAIALVIIFGLLYLKTTVEQVQTVENVEQTYKILSTIDYCEKTLVDAEGSLRGYFITQEVSYKDYLESRFPLVDSSLLQIEQYTAGNPNQRAFYNQLKKYVQQRVEIMKANISMKQNDPQFFMNLRKASNAMGNLRNYLNKMRVEEERVLQERIAIKKEKQQMNLRFFKATFFTACVICIILIGVFVRELNKRLVAQQHLKNKMEELSNSKNELEEITFAASHDLQEPMRKARILSTMVIKKLSNKLSDPDLEVVNRINKVTEQMQVLLNDLVVYTSLLNPSEKQTEVSLHEIFRSAFNKVFNNEPVHLSLYGNLPKIYGTASQLEIMVMHLFDNSLKFKSPQRELAISIHYEMKAVKESKYFWGFEKARQFHEVTITDNGIGFDKEYKEKIFGLFQRLHTQTEYPGKGIGLSIARRVMMNHNGHISSVGDKKEGASIILNFPVME